MSLFAAWCTVSGILFSFSIVYVCANSDQLEQLSMSIAEDKTISLPESVWAQLAFRGMFFVVGSILFAGLMAIVLFLIAAFADSFQDGDLALLLASWLGGLYCAALTRTSVKICFWTLWGLGKVTVGGI